MKAIPVASDLPAWTFLSNHAHVLICLYRNPESLLKEVARQVGITERAVQRIVTELEEGGYLSRKKAGRRNTYILDLSLQLRHPVEANAQLKDLVRLLG
jgi:DNA-binding MarR family transcriptional regulator